jgi:predicted nuclease with RNAse H fold
MHSESVTVVGIDCATQPQNTGLALGVFAEDRLVIQEVRRGRRHDRPVDIVCNWIRAPGRVLLALDAPLGWPTALGQSLVSHRAGRPIVAPANDLFRRVTDHEIHRRLKKLPLEVGADRIARTARAALELLDEMRQSFEVEMAWSPTWSDGVRAIEVYPAATRLSLGAPGGLDLVEWIGTRVQLPVKWCSTSDHEVDSILCAIAGGEFLRNRAQAPTEGQMDSARIEGWIWAGPVDRVRI